MININLTLHNGDKTTFDKVVKDDINNYNFINKIAESIYNIFAESNGAVTEICIRNDMLDQAESCVNSLSRCKNTQQTTVITIKSGGKVGGAIIWWNGEDLNNEDNPLSKIFTHLRNKAKLLFKRSKDKQEEIKK